MSGINVSVVIVVVNVMAAYTAITLVTSIVVHWYQMCNFS